VERNESRTEYLEQQHYDEGGKARQSKKRIRQWVPGPRKVHRQSMNEQPGNGQHNNESRQEMAAMRGNRSGNQHEGESDVHQGSLEQAEMRHREYNEEDRD
jgi:hypothetical protein